jgi:hypothetical protein
MRVVPVEEPQKYGEVVGVTEQPAPGSGVVVGVLTEQPAPGVVVGVVTAQPGASSGGAARGSLESLGRWNEKRSDRAMPIKLKAERDAETMVRVAFGKLVDELVQTNASSGILAIGNWRESRGDERHRVIVTVWGGSWSASPDDVSYQRHGFVGMQSDQSINVRFADFEGVVDDFGEINQNMAVYRVTLPSRGLDPEKWVGRPPPPAPEELYTGTRSDGLLSTDEVSGEYSAAVLCEPDPPFPIFCTSMSVVPLGADAIETWRTCCLFCPPLFIGPIAEGAVRARKPGTNAFLNPQNPDPNSDLMTFSADGTAKQGCCCGYKKCPCSQTRAFHKVETRDLAGKWCGCLSIPIMPYWPLLACYCTRKTALNEDQYEESGLYCWVGLPIPISKTRTRRYVNGHPTNGFASDYNPDPNSDQVPSDQWHRDPGCAADPLFFAKKLC